MECNRFTYFREYILAKYSEHTGYLHVIDNADNDHQYLTQSNQVAAQFQGKTLLPKSSLISHLLADCLTAELFKLSLGHWCQGLLHEKPFNRWSIGLQTAWHTKQGDDFGSSLCCAHPTNMASSVEMCSVGFSNYLAASRPPWRHMHLNLHSISLLDIAR